MKAPSVRDTMELSVLYKITGFHRLRRCWGIITRSWTCSEQPVQLLRAFLGLKNCLGTNNQGNQHKPIRASVM